jgi:predicted nucleic acid-binding Zn ribbon protein
MNTMSRYRRSNPTRLSVLINQNLSKLPLYSINKNWKNIVGNILFKSTTPLKIKDQTLIVGVSTHSWIQELNLTKETMLEKIKPYCASIKDVKFILSKKRQTP